MVACCSINMRIFKTTELLVLLLFLVFGTCSAAPGRFALHETDLPADLNNNPSNESSEPGDHYDQRQNGTENYRIHVDGIVVVVAPVEALLLAGGLPGAADSSVFGVNHGGAAESPSRPEEPLEPRPKPEDEAAEIVKDKSSDAKSAHRPGLRLMSLLSPLLRKVQPQH